MVMKTIAVIFGGQSTEHDVSIITALASVIKPLELAKQYNIEPVYIAKDGRWFWDQRLKDIKFYQSGQIEDFMAKAQPAQILFDGGLKLIKAGKLGASKSTKIDVVFPATHGTHGEDGDLMGILEMANVPYVGCGVAASAMAMDKVLAKQVAEAGDVIKSTPWIWFNSCDLVANTAKILESIKSLKYPLFVKPAHLGSSIGITRVVQESELSNALEVAAHYDDKVIVEQGVDNLVEVTLPIMGNQKPVAALLEQPLTKPEDFFDFDTKYMQGGKKGKGKSGAQGYSELPAKLPKDLYTKAQDVGLGVYMALGCSGIARVDMLIDSKTQQVFFNEVNPLPGGLYAHNWAKAGISNVDLVAKLIDLAEQRWQAKQKLTTSFSTNYLKQF